MSIIILLAFFSYAVILLILSFMRFFFSFANDATHDVISGMFYIWCSLAYASFVLLILGDVIGISGLYINELEESLGIKSPNRKLFFPMVILFTLFFFGGIRGIKDGRRKRK